MGGSFGKNISGRWVHGRPAEGLVFNEDLTHGKWSIYVGGGFKDVLFSSLSLGK